MLDLAGNDQLADVQHEVLSRIHRPLFAVVDGGCFDDLADELADKGIASRSLFRDGGDEALRRDGPWLVQLVDDHSREHMEALALERPCTVFWSCPKGEEALWRHLRTLNQILIPDTRIPDNNEKSGLPIKYERVIFRHWDPNVLASVLPLLDQQQLACLFGPAEVILMNGSNYDGLKRAIRPPELPGGLNGPLRIRPSQIEELKKAMLHSSRIRIARFLKGQVPPNFSGIDDKFLWGATLASESSADELGIKTERGRARWAYVMMLSDGKAAKLKEVRSYIQDGRDSPDNRVKSLIQHTANAIRTGGLANGALA
ncbi:DUF4123 domain-containing protein [Brucella cytisi]|uniref:DUF4123 domain-containing protein n=1 Tax=Brucella cytisi TaxID=407152 RepID=UPI001F3747C0|nr:DUF4123 domain-containing protein [Brucella cytisi]